MCRRAVRKKCIKSRRDSKSWRITTNLSGEKNRKRASPQETVILMKQTFEPFPLLSSTGNLKKGSQFSLNYKLPGRLLHRNQTALSDRLSPVRCSVHYRGFWLSCMSICEWFISCLISILDFVLFYKYTFQLCCALCLCVTDHDTDISSLLHADKTSVGMHVKVCFEKTVRTNIFSSLDKHWFCLYWLLLSVRKSGYNGCLWYP